jgi:glycosyltransferase involved in cell wall biosynthesis
MTWYSKYLQVYDKPFNLQMNEICEEVKSKLAAIQSSQPIATICVRGYNEEKCLLACLWSISESVCRYPIEIIGVDNDSADKTSEIFERCGVKCFSEKRRSPGWALKCGIEHAAGSYYINIDGDTLYPPKYFEKMLSVLEIGDNVAVTALWSYVDDGIHSKAGMFIYEFLRDCYLRFQYVKRPELVVRGMVFAFKTDLAKRVGIRIDIRRGEDGSLALGLKQYGNIAFLKDRGARVVTGYGTFNQGGSLSDNFKMRAVKAIKGLGGLFTSKKCYKDEKSNMVK